MNASAITSRRRRGCLCIGKYLLIALVLALVLPVLAKEPGDLFESCRVPCFDRSFPGDWVIGNCKSSDWIMVHRETGDILGWSDGTEISRVWTEIPEILGGAVIEGRVTNADFGLPIPDGFARIFDDTGSSVGLAFMDNDGDYSFGGLAAGTYFVRTESTGFFDELWDDIPCPQGACVVTSGTPIVLMGTDVATADFVLGSEVSEIFSDGFESGDLSAWSAAVPVASRPPS